MEEQKNISLKNVNILFLIVISILCVLLVVCTTVLVLKFNKYADNSDDCYEVSKASLEMQEGSDYLTNEARFFILTSDIIHLNNYFYERNEVRRREKAVEELALLNIDNAALSYLNEVLKKSIKLEELELYAMKLVVDGKQLYKDSNIYIPEEISKIQLKPEDKALSDEYKVAQAWVLLFSQDYMLQKQAISDLNNMALSSIIAHTEQSHMESYEELRDIFFRMIVCVALILVFTIILFIIIRTYILKPLYSNIKNIKQGKQLPLANTREFNVLTSTYNEMFDKNEAKEILLKHKAEHDELTGILNRGAFNQIKAVYTNTSEKLALIIIDIDFFKQINDTYGHSTGDLVLKRVANTLKENFRNSDYVARIGGDEFSIILTKCDNEPKVTEKLISSKLEVIKEQLAAEDKENNIPPVTLSCGIDISFTGYNDWLYEHADAALYDIKRSGRNGYRFYEENLQEKQ